LGTELEKHAFSILWREFDVANRGFISFANFEGVFQTYKKRLQDKQTNPLGKTYRLVPVFSLGITDSCVAVVHLRGRAAACTPSARK
jgi:hypothetical protein